MMELDERIISRYILDRFHEKLRDNLDVDVAIVGGGPSGLVAGYYLARSGRKVALFERRLSLGGGMWGGGMMMNEIVIQEAAVHILDEFGIRYRRHEENYYSVDSVECVATLTSRAVQAGMTAFNCIYAEDVMMRENRVIGLVINWSTVDIARFYVDPLTVRAQFVLDATGHAADVVRVAQEKVPGRLLTPSGKIEGEKSLWSDRAETLTVENTREAFPGLYVSGMAANAVFGGPRMGPIFGGMLLSGEVAAERIERALSEQPVAAGV